MSGFIDRPWRKAMVAALLSVALGCNRDPVAVQTQATWGPLASANPYLGPLGTATMHGDAGSSDATPLAGPGTGLFSVGAIPLVAACPTVLEGSDGLIVALCTALIGQTPTVHLINPALIPLSDGTLPAAASVAQLPLPKGSLLGGVYAFLDNQNRLVAVDGDRRLVRVAHTRNRLGTWQLAVEQSVDLSGVIPNGDNVTGLAPDWQGNVWFATGAGLVGRINAAGAAQTLQLPVGERVANSISTSPVGTAVATTHALYQLSAGADEGTPNQLNAGADGTLKVVWRAPYNRGSARKPGQLSWGTGSTPTYFGPNTGYDYLTIVDNADNQVSLLVYETATGALICSQPVLTSGGAGSENSPIGVGNSVFVASTYGYPYPTVPADVGTAVPASAPFTGGMTRVDVTRSGCSTVWDNVLRSAAVPHLSTADGLLYTVLRQGLDTTTPLDGFAFAAINPHTGQVLRMQNIPGTIMTDTLQMSGLITSKGHYMQGILTGILRIRAF